MSTATMRLRRAGAGGLAAAVIVGTLLTSAGIASAALSTGGVLTAASQTSVSPGTNLAVGNLTLSIMNNWAPGDNVVLTNPSQLHGARFERRLRRGPHDCGQWPDHNGGWHHSRNLWLHHADIRLRSVQLVCGMHRAGRQGHAYSDDDKCLVAWPCW